MGTLDEARATQLSNIESKTGKRLPELREVIQKSGLTKHSEIRAMLMKEFKLGYGDANSLVYFAKKSEGQSAAQVSGASIDDVTEALYAGAKAGLRPIHEKILQNLRKFGEFEVVPKKGYVSLRRKKQFAMVGPGTKGRLEVGLNMKGVKATDRLEALPPGGMCQYRVSPTSPKEVEAEFPKRAKAAFDSSG